MGATDSKNKPLAEEERSRRYISILNFRQMNDGELYFYNFETKESSWEHPSDDKYRQMVREERKNLQLKNALAKNAKVCFT